MSLMASERFRYPFFRTIRSSWFSSALLKETPKRAIWSFATGPGLYGESHDSQFTLSFQCSERKPIHNGEKISVFW